MIVEVETLKYLMEIYLRSQRRQLDSIDITTIS